MQKKDIEKILNDLNIEVSTITPASNSFNSNVYIIESYNKKYVFKINTSKKKTDVESKYITYLNQYLVTPKVLATGLFEDNSYIIMTYLKGQSILDEEANSLSKNQLKNIGRLLGTLHNLPLIDVENDSWINYLDSALEKTQDVLRNVFEKDNDIIYNYLKNYITNNLKGKYKNSILHMDFRIGNLIIDNNRIGLIDMESMKNGEYAFDFVKLYRVLSDSNFNVLLSGYKEKGKIDKNFMSKLNFYTLYDSYTSLWWSASRNKTDSDFYKMNYAIVKKYLGVLNEKGYI